MTFLYEEIHLQFIPEISTIGIMQENTTADPTVNAILNDPD
jgi:hypothetical protein